MQIIAIVVVALGLLFVNHAVVSAEGLSQADRDWLRLQCDGRHSSKDCSDAMNLIQSQGKTITAEDIQLAVQSCARSVRALHRDSEFDAYVKRGAVHSFGTPSERFQFSKCMHNLGFDFSDPE